MKNQPHRRSEAKTIWRFVLCGALIVFACGLYLYRVPIDPPGFYIDESSIAYNAHTISQTGRDEYGVAWPLYFRAFGEYKNPTLIYLLAIIFRFTGPSILVARVLSALLGVSAALLIGLLAWRLSRQFHIAILIALSASLTPWLYESSRLVFEAAAYPLVTVLFLSALHRAAARPAWKMSDVFFVAATLALLTYTYSIGRLLGPLLAIGLLLFLRKQNWRAIAATIGAYGLTLLPMLMFAARHPGALMARFGAISYVSGAGSLRSVTGEFLKHYFANLNPWTMLVTGEQNPRDHVAGMGSLLLVTLVVGVIGLVIVTTKLRRDAWWRFIVYALFASVVPAALTVNEFPQLRLIAFPMFLHLLMIPALMRLTATNAEGVGRTRSLKPVLLFAAIALIILQGLYFQVVFHRESPARWYFMDARFARKVLDPVLALNRRPIYLIDPLGKSGYIQALWHAALRGIPASDFVRLSAPQPAPADHVVISTEADCTNCRLIGRGFNYIVYVVLPSNAEANVSPLPPEAFRAQISLRQAPTIIQTGQPEALRVSVKNISLRPWPCVGDASGRYSVVVRARWLKPEGAFISNAGRSELNYDLEPGDVNDVDLEVTPPSIVGDYVLEIDLVEEPDTWFSQNGSEILRVPIAVGSRE